MSIAIGTFRKVLMKTLTPKPTKLALRLLSKNTQRVNLVNAAGALTADAGALLVSTRPYLLGQQFTADVKDATTGPLGDIGADITVLCRLLKVKLPSSTKKLKLAGTRTVALLRVQSLSTDIFRVLTAGIGIGPQMQTVTKDVVLPNKGGIKESRTVEVVDAAQEAQAENQRQEMAKGLLTELVDLYWRLNFDIYGQPPAYVLDRKAARLEQAHPGVSFAPTPKPVKKAVTPVAAPKKKVQKVQKIKEAVGA